MTATLEARDLYRFYHAGDEETLALRGVSLAAGAGEMVAVTGPSGSGKSTLLACLAGLDEPDGGTVTIDGAPITRRPEPERASIRGRAIGMLFQSANLFEHLTVADNIRVARRVGRRTTSASVLDLLESLSIGHRSGARPSELSGGELARAGLAVALANEPRVLLADEPTGELDHDTASQLVELLRQRRDTGTAVVVVTHSATLAGEADRVVTMRDGRILQ